MRIYLDRYFTADNHDRRLYECHSSEGEKALDDILEGKNPLRLGDKNPMFGKHWSQESKLKMKPGQRS